MGSYFNFDGVGEVIDKATPSKWSMLGVVCLIFAAGCIVGFVLGAS